ncbi:dihydrofolate reductase family protein [uncultured Ruegeria sp.]|uniref:dihydrofolate reductase family protein n=1 Tax=uncultured Ruegeria sp. TaxID=259304 RepID=UPI0026067DE5|nr:dihydrofolate reductase family protein [uncultured Ruegeria sp.]
MRKLAILTFQTLDGVIQAPMSPDEDRSGGFSQGGWAAPFWEDVMGLVSREAMSDPYDMLFGRKTYDAFASHWPNVRNDPVADMMNAARKYVVSSGSPELPWHRSELVSGDILPEITALKQQDGALLQVHGSAGLIKTLLAHDLIDEYRIWTFPVMVGPGKRLFEAGVNPHELSLEREQATSKGVVMTIYRRRQPITAIAELGERTEKND